jgi:hypothetical protein
MENQWLWFLAIAITIAFFVAYFGLERYRKQRRTQQMRAAAAQLGYEFIDHEGSLAGALDGFALLARGRNQERSNFLRTRMDGTTVTLFDHGYITGSGRRQRTFRQSVLLMEPRALELPAFSLRPERFGEKLQGLKGRPDIDFDNQPRFSSAYALEGADEARIRTLLSSEKLAFFAGHPGLGIESNGPRLLYYRPGKRVSPGAIPAFLAEGLAALNVLAGQDPTRTG